MTDSAAFGPTASHEGPLFTRRHALLAGLGAGSALILGAGSASAALPSSQGNGPLGGASVGSSTGALSGLHDGLVVTDLEVVTVTENSVTFYWAAHQGPYLPYGEQAHLSDEFAPAVPTDAEIRIRREDAAGELQVVHSDATERGYHLVTIGGLDSGTRYRFECRSAGIVATPSLIATSQTWSPERTGIFTTLTPPPGEHVLTVAIFNDVHIGLTHLKTEVLTAAAVAEISRFEPDTLVVNGDVTAEGRPWEVRMFKDIMGGYGTLGSDWFATRGNHDRPHTVAEDGSAGYDEVPELAEAPGFHDGFGEILGLPRQQAWTNRVGELRVIGIDTAMLDAGNAVLDDAQIDAVAAELAADPSRPTILFGHHPMTFESGVTNGFAFDQGDSYRLQKRIAEAPGVFMVAAGHTHRNRRTESPWAPGVDFAEFGATGQDPVGYTVLRLYTGGYMVNYHRVGEVSLHPGSGEQGSDYLLEWAAKGREYLGLSHEYVLGTTAHRNYVVRRDLSALAPGTDAPGGSASPGSASVGSSTGGAAGTRPDPLVTITSATPGR